MSRRSIAPAAFVFATSLCVGMLCTARPAAAEGLPIGWAWAMDSESVTVTVQAFDVIDDVEVEIRRHHDGHTFEFSRPRMQPDEVWDLGIDYPSRTSEYTITVSGAFAGIPGQIEDRFAIEVAAPMDFEVDTDSFDTENRRFTMTMTQPAGHVEIVVRGDTGELLTERTVTFDGEAPGTPLQVEWTQGPGNIMTVDVRAVSASGTWSSRQYIPWKVEFDAAHVNFASGSAEIPASDVPMLRERFAEISSMADRVAEWIEVKLYVGGYTDTVGSNTDNQGLSERRARSIAEFFRGEGAGFEIYYQGFGESALAVQTADNVDEPENRRSIFILSTREPPRSSSVPRSDWRQLD